MATQKTTRLGCGCGGDYASGPTACFAHPKVIASIKRQVRTGRVLSAADARLATLAGMLDIPAVGKTGFNDGVIYPPEDGAGPALGPAMASTTAKFASKKASAKQTLNCLVLMVDFSDNPGKTASSHFQDLLFNTANPNSMASFYNEMSFGKLSITGTVTGWIRAAKPYAYYTDSSSGTGRNFPKNTPGLLDEILRKYCATNSLAPFDVNGDGFVDGLFLIHAGGGAEAEPTPAKRKQMIWSHKWTLPSPFVNSGVKAYAYFTAPEDGKLGVFSHEFGHFLGLPDLYDTTYRSFGIGDWCLMAGGSWNGGGDVPARLSAWCLSELRWITPKNVTASATIKLDTLANDKTACRRLWTGGAASKEYFLVENRQQVGRDAELPGSGLALWHIDDTQSDNSNARAYRVALVQADGLRHLELSANPGDGDDLFPGTGGVVSVNDTSPSHPHTRDNGGAATGVSLSKIRVSKGKVSFAVKV